MESSQPDAKVLLRGGGGEVETLWAFKVGTDKYRLDNLPFYAYGVSLGDVVLTSFHEDEGFPVFERAVEKSGNRTVRVIFDAEVDASNDAQRVLDSLVALGCGYEGTNKRLIAINVPPEVKLEVVCTYLSRQRLNWEHADPTYEALHPGCDI